MENWIRCSFNDDFGLTKAAIDGEKTQFRVIACYKKRRDGNWVKKPPTYDVGDEIPLLQPYCDIPEMKGTIVDGKAGWRNKRFCKNDYMPFRIRIMSVHEERLHDLTESDALAEGVKTYRCEGLPDVYTYVGNDTCKVFKTPRSAFAAMCDKLYDVTTWRNNPNVYVYEFEMIPNVKFTIPELATKRNKNSNLEK